MSSQLVSSVGNLKILPEIPAVDAEAKRLKAKGVDIIIALGHSGFEADVEIAKHVEDIDLVIGGHSNTFLYTGEWCYTGNRCPPVNILRYGYVV